MYQRFVQWTAGPISIGAGWLATKLVTHTTFFGSLGLGKSAIAHAIIGAATFGVGALTTYAAHHKWLSNLPKWWSESGLILPAVLDDLSTDDPSGNATTVPEVTGKPESAMTPDPPVQSGAASGGATDAGTGTGTTS